MHQSNYDLSNITALLHKILVQAGVYTLADWAVILSTPDETVTDWLRTDAPSFPQPENLRAIFRTVAEDERFSVELLKEVEEFVITENLANYINEPLRSSFNRVLDSLHPAVQEHVILEASQLCRDLREKPGELPWLLTRPKWVMVNGILSFSRGENNERA